MFTIILAAFFFAYYFVNVAKIIYFIKKVAEFYNIPEKHVKDIIRKTKLELRHLCLNTNI